MLDSVVGSTAVGRASTAKVEDADTGESIVDVGISVDEREASILIVGIANLSSVEFAEIAEDGTMIIVGYGA